MLGLEAAVYIFVGQNTYSGHDFMNVRKTCPAHFFLLYAHKNTNTFDHHHYHNHHHLQGIMKPPPAPQNDTHVLLEQFWVEAGDLERIDPEGIIFLIIIIVLKYARARALLAMMNKYPRFLNSLMMHKKILWLNFFD